MDDEERQEYVPSKALSKYPFTINIDGTDYIVARTESQKSLVQTIDINVEGGEINDSGMEKHIDVSAIIKLYKTTEDKYIIDMKDEIFFPNHRYVYIDVPGYVIDRYAQALSAYRRLGYDEVFLENRKTEKELLEVIKNRKTLIVDWWIDVKLYGRKKL